MTQTPEMSEDQINRLLNLIAQNTELRSVIHNAKAELEHAISKVAERQIKVETKLASVCAKVGSLEQHEERLDQERLIEARQKLDTQRASIWKIVGIVVGLAGYMVGLIVWGADVTNKINQIGLIEKDAKIALDVARQHGEEFNQVRKHADLLQKQVHDNAAAVVDVATRLADDRFRGADWERERVKLLKEIDLQYQRRKPPPPMP